MADEADIANAYITNAIEAALGSRQQRANPAKVITKECKGCGEEIPLARRQLGFPFCISCAEESERRKSLFVDY